MSKVINPIDNEERNKEELDIIRKIKKDNKFRLSSYDIYRIIEEGIKEYIEQTIYNIWDVWEDDKYIYVDVEKGTKEYVKRVIKDYLDRLFL